MDYKAKYETALKWAKSVYPNTVGTDKEDLERIFPELKNGSIRKALIELVHNTKGDDLWINYDVHKSDVLAWLKNQDEKPQGKSALDAINEKVVDNANKVEPKFRVGDWIIRSTEGFKHNIYLITEIRDYYICTDIKGKRVTFTFNDVHKNFKLLDIRDVTPFVPLQTWQNPCANPDYPCSNPHHDCINCPRISGGHYTTTTEINNK